MVSFGDFVLFLVCYSIDLKAVSSVLTLLYYSQVIYIFLIFIVAYTLL